MVKSSVNELKTSFGSAALDTIVERLQRTSDSRKRYEYLLWLGTSDKNVLPDLEDLVAKTIG